MRLVRQFARRLRFLVERLLQVSIAPDSKLALMFQLIERGVS